MYVDQWIQFMMQKIQDVQVIIQEKNQSSTPEVANVNNVSVWCTAKVIFFKFAKIKKIWIRILLFRYFQRIVQITLSFRNHCQPAYATILVEYLGHTP